MFLLFFFQIHHSKAASDGAEGSISLIHIQETSDQLKAHLKALTVTIGERSVRFPENLNKTVEYIHSFYKEIGLQAWSEPYDYRGFEVANVVTEISSGPNPARRYLLGSQC